MHGRIALAGTRRTSPLLMVMAASLVAACAAEPKEPVRDDPDVYVAAVDLLFARDSAAEPVVLVDDVLELDSSAIESAIASIPIVNEPDSTSRNFTAKSLRVGRMPPIEAIRSRTTAVATVASRVTMEQLRAQADSDARRDPQRYVTSVESYWQRVHETFAPAKTLIRLSPAAYSHDGKHAIMHLTYSCGALCGGSYWIAFSRNRSGWTVRHVRPTSVS